MNYSIIIPAYNEEALLPQTLETLKSVMGEIPQQGEIIVADNNSSDRTSEIARLMGATVVFEKEQQISKARNAGAAVAQGQFFIFIDADTLVSAALLKDALQTLEKGKHCGGGSTLVMDREVDYASKLALDTWNGISKRFQFAAGSFVFVSKEGFEAVGGFSEKVYASEEIWFSRSLKTWGKEQKQAFKILTGNPVITSARKMDQPLRVWGMLITTLLFPFAIRFRALCWFWYKRVD